MTTPASMKAVVQQAYGPLDQLRVMDWPVPTPGPNQLLIRVHAAGVDPGIWHTLTGQPRMVRLMGLGFSKPKIPIAGWDAAGVVEQVGSAVTRFKVGDAVLGNNEGRGTGTFAERAVLPEECCAKKPDSMTFEQAAALPVSGCTALQALRDVVKLQAGQKVLVIGAAGGVGHFAVQIAKAMGAQVTGVCGPDKLELVRSLGADHVVDYTKHSTLVGTVGTFDAIVDTAGRRSFDELAALLNPSGTLAIVGGEGGNVWTGEFLERIAGAAVRSLFGTRRFVAVSSKVNHRDLEALVTLFEKGVKPAIAKTYALDRSIEALKELERGHARGKSVVTV